MRMRLLTTAAALALFASGVAPVLAIAQGQTPTSSSGSTTGTSTSTGGSLSEPAGVDSNATTPPVYAPSSGAGSPRGGAGSAGTGTGSVSPAGTSSSGTLGNSTSPAVSPGGTLSSGASPSPGSSTMSSNSSAPLAPTGSATGSLPGRASGRLSTGSIVASDTIAGAPSADASAAPTTGPVMLPPSPSTGYVGAGYETSVGATAHFMSARAEAGMNGASRYDVLARELSKQAGTTSIAGHPWTELFDRESELRIEPDSTRMAGDRGGK